MGRSQIIIPLSPAGAGCSSGAAAGCASASSCSAASACDASDPLFRLQQEGWVLRTTIGEPRLSEVAENYRAMGYDVHVEYFATAATGAASCTTCLDAADHADAKQSWGSIYVRPGRPGARRDEELY